MGHADEPIETFAQTGLGRRRFVFLGLFAVAGCATTNDARELPGPIWPELQTSCPLPPPPPVSASAPASTAPAPIGGVKPRAEWARGAPICSLMNPMLPVRHITVHHDGMSPFVSTDEASSAARIELIRNGHRGNGWGDIGYHFVIDRSGRIWQGRALNWQGAHVKNWNEGNLGVMCLGNFEEQAPSSAQLDALERHLRILMKTYGVPKSRVKTHKEWAGAKTLCPGKSLQKSMVEMRRGSALA